MPKLLAAAIATCLAGHVYLGFALGLSVDEAHYALYALHPALSYFDHPPLVGWVQIPFVFAGGADWLLRIVPLALWGITAWALLRFSKWALVLFLLSPIHELLGLALVPDTLLLPLTLWVMVLTWKLSTNIACRPYWIWLGVALGLAGLSKYTGVFLALGVAIVLLPRYSAALFKQVGFWWAMVIAAALVSPVFIWNAQHDWVSFAYQINHADGNANGWQAKRVLAYSLVQVVTYGALPILGLIVFLLKLRPKHAGLMQLCLAFGLPALLVTVFLAGKGAALPHWTASSWIALLPLAALGLQHFWNSGAGAGSNAALQAKRVLACGLGALQALSVLGLGLAMATGGHWQGKPLLTSTSNPFADLHDWQEAAKQATKLQAEHKVEALAVSNWTLASRLAWYGRPSKVLALDGKNKQFDIWFGKLEYGQSYLWVDWSGMRQPKPVGCQKLETSSYQGKYSQFDFYKCGRV